MYFAVCQGVPVKLCAYISPYNLRCGQVYVDTCVAISEFSVNSSAARCGIPGQPQSSDEVTIQNVVDKFVNGFNGVNQSVEMIRLSYLAKCPINDVGYNRKGEIRKIKDGIEYIIPRTNVGNDLKTYDQYLQSEKMNYDEDENAKTWLMYIQDKLMPTK